MLELTNYCTPLFSELEELIRKGTQEYFQAVLEDEVKQYTEKYKNYLNESKHRLVKKNGYLPKRKILTGMGPLEIKQPRVRDSRKNETFSSKILPRYLRKAPSLDNLIPVLYLKGVSTKDFSTALESILGKEYKGYSAKTVERLKNKWSEEYTQWKKQSLQLKKYVYIWADGIYFNVRLGSPEGKKLCFLVIIGALEDGTKELIGVNDGFRESTFSWKNLLLDLKERGMCSPKLAIGDGATGFWKAIAEVFPDTRHQRCWVHKTGNVLDKMSKSVQYQALEIMKEMYNSHSKKDALKAYKSFLNKYMNKYPQACNCLIKDEDNLFTFYDFPGIHWQHIRTTNPIESTFATVRLRTKKTKGCGSRNATLIMVFKLCLEAEKGWQKLRGSNKLPLVFDDIRCVDGLTIDEWKVGLVA